MSNRICQRCHTALTRREQGKPYCHACRGGQTQVQAFAPTTPDESFAPPADTADRPWMPGQLLGAAVLFGPLACGLAAGINFARLGMRQYLVPCILLGAVAFLLQATFVIFVISGEASQFVAVAINLAIAWLFQTTQKPVFEAWKEAYWKPETKGATYKPNQLGLLFLVGFASLAVEVVIVYLLLGIERSR
jgi:hypothetical protein